MTKETALTHQTHGAWEQFADGGYEETRIDDYSRSFVYVLQALSPPVRERRMHEGNLWITGIDLEVERDPGLIFIPVYTQQRYVEWVPREKGGGFVATHQPTDEIVLRAQQNGTFGNYQSPEGNDLIQTFYLFAMAELTGGVWKHICFPITSMKIRQYNSLRSKLDFLRLPSGKRYPLFAHKCRATTVKETKSNNDFFNIRFALAAPSAEECRLDMQSPLFKEVTNFYASCHTGLAKIDYAASRSDEETTVQGTAYNVTDCPF